jgi:hypothetical protein
VQHLERLGSQGDILCTHPQKSAGQIKAKSVAAQNALAPFHVSTASHAVDHYHSSEIFRPKITHLPSLDQDSS